MTAAEIWKAITVAWPSGSSFSACATWTVLGPLGYSIVFCFLAVEICVESLLIGIVVVSHADDVEHHPGVSKLVRRPLPLHAGLPLPAGLLRSLQVILAEASHCMFSLHAESGFIAL